MRRSVILAFGILVLLFAGVIVLLFFYPRAEPPRMSLNAADENVVDPLRAEMACIDRVMSSPRLNANEVQPRLDACRGGGGGGGNSAGNRAAAR